MPCHLIPSLSPPQAKLLLLNLTAHSGCPRGINITPYWFLKGGTGSCTRTGFVLWSSCVSNGSIICFDTSDTRFFFFFFCSLPYDVGSCHGFLSQTESSVLLWRGGYCWEGGCKSRRIAGAGLIQLLGLSCKMSRSARPNLGAQRASMLE